MAIAAYGNENLQMQDEEYSVVLQKVSGLMNFVSEYKDAFGLTGVDLNDVYLSGNIPAYRIEGQSAVRSETRYYPILDAQGEVIALIIGVEQENGDITISFTTEYNEMLNQEAINQPICFLNVEDDLELVTEEMLFAFNVEKDEIEAKTLKKNMVAFEKKRISEQDRIAVTSSTSSVMNMLDVDVYKQATGTNT